VVLIYKIQDQSVVIRAEKGKVRMLLDGESGASQKELVYDARKDIDHEHDQTPYPRRKRVSVYGWIQELAASHSK
jgi:hypothetical protein